MSTSNLLLKAEELEKLKENALAPAGLPPNFKFKGFILYPYIDENSRPAILFNPVFGLIDSEGVGDYIILKKNVKACPYPPGYGS